MSKAIGYVRVSSLEQAKSGLGLADQRKKIRRAAKRLGLELEEILSDGGKSGDLPAEERPGLLEALGGLEKGDVLLVAKRDRLGRDVEELVLVERNVRKTIKARIVSAAGEGTESDDPDSVFMRRMIDAFAERELALIRARTKAALQIKKERGERVGTIPFGAKLGADGKTLINCMEEQRVIRRVFKLEEKGLSQRATVRKLEADGVVSPRSGNPLALYQVQRILRGGKGYGEDA
jgi:DNA invertase Pin-like site-specific DNA recombinase